MVLLHVVGGLLNTLTTAPMNQGKGELQEACCHPAPGMQEKEGLALRGWPPACGHITEELPPSTARPRTLRLVEGRPGPGPQRVGNTMPIVTLPASAQKPRTAGHHPQALCPVPACQEEAFPG